MGRIVGQVVNGQIVVIESGIVLREGATVYIEAADQDAWIELTPEEAAELDRSMEKAERGEGIDAFEFLKQLRDGTWRDAR